MNTDHPRPSYIDSFVCVPPYRNRALRIIDESIVFLSYGHKIVTASWKGLYTVCYYNFWSQSFKET